MIRRQSWQLKKFLKPRNYIDDQGYLVIESVNNSGVRVTSRSKEPFIDPAIRPK